MSGHLPVMLNEVLAALEPRDGGLPGVPNLFGSEGVGIEVPEEEAADATLLVKELLKDMERPDS